MLRRLSAILPIILLLGSGLLLFFINLSGATNSGVLARFYWSEAETSNIQGAHFQKTRWTSYSSCEGSSGVNSDCTKHSPAYPYSPRDNFGSSSSLPTSFNKHRDTYFYLSRFAYAFFLIGLVFNVVALAPVFLTIFFSGLLTGLISTLAVGLSLLFTLGAACFITAAHVKGRNAFKDDGYNAHLGVKAFGITWAAVACLLLSFAWAITISALGGKQAYLRNRNEKAAAYDNKSLTSSASYQYNGAAAVENYEAPNPEPTTYTDEEPQTASRFKFFRIKRAAPAPEAEE